MGRFENLEISIKQKPTPEDIDKGYDEVYYLRLAHERELNGDFEVALRYYSRALNYRIEIQEAWMGQVMCLIDLGEFDEAIIWADKGIEVTGENAELVAVKAMALGRKGEIDRALAYSDQSIKKGKNSAIIWLCRGDIIIAKDINNADLCFKKAIECEKNNPYIYLRIALSFMSVKEPAPALANLKKALELNPKNPFINFLIGKCYETIGVRDNALNYYEKALKSKPDYQDCLQAYLNLKNVGMLKRVYYWLCKNIFRTLEVK